LRKHKHEEGGLPPQHRREPLIVEKQRQKKIKRNKNPKPLLDWLRELAILDRQWRKEGKYGKHMVEKVERLIEKKPTIVTDVLISPSTYQMRFGTKKRKSSG